ncbi:unnamed protein product [Porites evermanni]|uniref:Uncharacterized protein n=1 Tax=Porites evermanni TaxID=104178 RepID=A0ABN8MKU1_9CNID|nr:unnamed protein product [Porites evermanni]
MAESAGCMASEMSPMRVKGLVVTSWVAAPEIIKSTEDGLQQALLEHSLSSYLLELASSREQLLFCYQGMNHKDALTCISRASLDTCYRN